MKTHHVHKNQKARELAMIALVIVVLCAGYYGYISTLLPFAIIYKNDQIYSYSPDDLPANWNENHNFSIT